MDLHGSFHVYDTTLRDGAQQEGLNLSVADKLTIARQLDGLGVGYIEGGWPGANPKDTEFFRRAREELKLQHAELAASDALGCHDAEELTNRLHTDLENFPAFALDERCFTLAA